MNDESDHISEVIDYLADKIEEDVEKAAPSARSGRGRDHLKT